MRPTTTVRAALVAAAAFVTLTANHALAAAFGPQSIVLVATDSTTNGGAAANNIKVALREYSVALVGGTPSISLVQTIPLPDTAAASGNRALTVQNSAAVEGRLTRSADNQYLFIGGYNTTSGTAGSGGSAADRVVGRIDMLGNVDTTTAIPSSQFPSNSAPRAIVSDDGNNLWFVTSGAGVRYGTYQGTTLTQLVGSNGRTAGIHNGQLYLALQTTSAAPNGPAQGIASVGTGLPTTAGQTSSALPGFPASTSSNSGGSPYDFFFADDNTLYVADDANSSTSTGGIQKWVFDPAQSKWTKAFTIASAQGVGSVRGLTGTVDDLGNVYLFATQNFTNTGANALYGAVDTLSNTTTAPTATTLLNAEAGIQFRSLAFVPEPSSLFAACGLALFTLCRRHA